MAIDKSIVAFGQQASPVIRGLESVAQGAQAIRQGNERAQRQEQIANNKQAYQLLGQAFSDESDDATTDALIEKARELAPDLVFQIEQQMRSQTGKSQAKPFEQAKGEGLEGYSFDPNTGKFSIDQETKAILETKAAEKAAQGSPLEAKDRKGINKDVTDLTKDARLITNTAKDLRRLGSIKSGPASIALVFKFMKSLDPTSVVREGEFATAENSAGVPEGIRNIYNRLANGERLGEKQISEFINTADQLSESAASAASIEVSGYLDSYEDTIPQSFKDKLLRRIPRVDIPARKEKPDQPEPETKRIEAPAAAITFLRQNPDAADQFRAKYGYLPEGS